MHSQKAILAAGLALAATLAAAQANVIVLGQISMAGARSHLPPDLAGRVLTSSDAAVARLRALIGP